MRALSDAFQVFDADNDGKLTEEEVIGVLTRKTKYGKELSEEAARARQHRAAARAVAARYQQRPPRPSSAREPRHYERPLSGRPASARREVDRSARAERERRLCGGAVAVTSGENIETATVAATDGSASAKRTTMSDAME